MKARHMESIWQPPDPTLLPEKAQVATAATAVCLAELDPKSSFEIRRLSLQVTEGLQTEISLWAETQVCTSPGSLMTPSPAPLRERR